MRFPKKLKDSEIQTPNEENNDDQDCRDEENMQNTGIPKLIELNHAQGHFQRTHPAKGFPSQQYSEMQEENIQKPNSNLVQPSIEIIPDFSPFDRGEFDGDFVPDGYWDDPNFPNCETWSNPDRFGNFFQEEELPITNDERAESMLVEALTESQQPKSVQRIDGGFPSNNTNYWMTNTFLQTQESKGNKGGSQFSNFRGQNQFLDLHTFEFDQDYDCNHLAHAKTRMEGFGMAEEAMNSGKYELSEQQGILGTAVTTTGHEKSTAGKKINRQPISQFETEPNRKQSKTTSDEIFSQTEDYTTSVPSHLLAPRPICNCKNSKCLKLYCACFRKGIACCVECKCVDCQNNTRGLGSNSLKRKQRNAIHRAEAEESCCNCRMSFCEKSYCVCARNGKGCGPNCKCFNCKNPLGTKAAQQNNRP